ncbi:MAG: glycosyltransferase family 1 protein [Anaerolineae bacterium]|nr:MAG: glycosyltransferase family 1 protein [Anaerolineae bacterium]
MRIAMISYHTCPLAVLGGKDTGGMNVYVRELTRALGKMGVRVDVYTRSQDEHAPHVSHDLGYGNRVVHVPAGPQVPLPKQVLARHLPTFVEHILEFAARKNFRYDLIHSHYWMSGIAARDLKAAWDVPVIQMFHTLGEMKRRVAQSAEEAEGAYRIQGEREVIALADRIVAATTAELAQLQWLYGVDPAKIVVIPPGVDTGHFYPIPPDEAKEFIGIPASDTMLLYVGRIEPLKGVGLLIEAIGRMRARGGLDGRHLCISIIGGDPHVSREEMSAEMARLHDLRLQNGLEDLVTFLGRRGQDTLPYYYSAADAVVMPSYYESFGMVALEAMACGTPVVASQVGGLAFLVQDGETGFHIPVGDVEALADRLTRLLNDRRLRQRMAARAVEFARGYAWKNIAEQVFALYRQVAPHAPLTHTGSAQSYVFQEGEASDGE